MKFLFVENYNGHTSKRRTCLIKTNVAIYSKRVWIRTCHQRQQNIYKVKKNTKYSFFQNFKHLNQQQHKINILLHEYEKKTEI